jgi:transposase
MLLESICRKTLGFKGFRVKKVQNGERGIEILVVPRKRSQPICSECGGKRPGYDSLQERSFRHVPLWGIATWILYQPRRVSCPGCGIRVEKIPWGLGKCPLSLPLVVVTAVWAKLLPWETVGGILGVHWNTVKAAVDAVVRYGLEKRDLEGVLAIGIDEISRKRGHRYMTNVYDLGGMRLIWTGEGREEATLDRFFAEMGEGFTAKLKGICCDMWSPYLKVVKKKAPLALLVFDKFHLIRHLLDAVDEVRREEARELEKEYPDLLKGTRYLFLKNPWNLTEKQRLRLQGLEKLNLRINRAYLLKEAFREFWDYLDPEKAKEYLSTWLSWASHSRLQPFVEFARMVRRHKKGILNWFEMGINNGMVEALNRKAKLIAARAYGYRTPHTFALAMYHCLGNLEMPTLTHKFL